jgi:glycosyltransferase involved in cell wall biosynthesis
LPGHSWMQPDKMHCAEGVVIIPALNEGSRIGVVLDRARNSMPELDLLVIDDGSRDDTAECALDHGARVVSHPFNLGYGAALQTGYKVADREAYRYLVQMDADGQHDPADIGRLLAPLRASAADVVVGSRFVEATGYRMGTLRSAGRAFFRRILILAGGPPITDPTSGFQALSRRAFRLCCNDFYPSDFPDINVLLLVHRHGFQIVEVPVHMAPNPPSHTPMHAGFGVLYYTYKMMLSTLRSAVTPRVIVVPDFAAKSSPNSEEIAHESKRSGR